MKIVTFGEIMLRLSKHSGQRLFQNGPFDTAYGGSEANVAVSLAQLGDDVEYVTRVPNNAIGDAALMHLRELGLNVRHTVRGGKRLGTYYFEPAAAMRGSRVVYDRDDSSFNTMAYGDIDWEPILTRPTCSTARASPAPPHKRLSTPPWRPCAWPTSAAWSSHATSTIVATCGNILGPTPSARCVS